MDYLLIADIGGTNARMILYALERLTHEYKEIKKTTFITNNFDSLSDIIKNFFGSVELEKDAYLYGCVAMAGLVREN